MSAFKILQNANNETLSAYQTRLSGLLEELSIHQYYRSSSRLSSNETTPISPRRPLTAPSRLQYSFPSSTLTTSGAAGVAIHHSRSKQIKRHNPNCRHSHCRSASGSGISKGISYNRSNSRQVAVDPQLESLGKIPQEV